MHETGSQLSGPWDQMWLHHREVWLSAPDARGMGHWGSLGARFGVAQPSQGHKSHLVGYLTIFTSRM